MLIIRKLSHIAVFLAACCLAACTEDVPEPSAPGDGVTGTRTRVDSTAVVGGIPVAVDTVWADTLRYDFDGNPIEPPVEFNVNDSHTKDAAEAV